MGTVPVCNLTSNCLATQDIWENRMGRVAGEGTLKFVTSGEVS